MRVHEAAKKLGVSTWAIRQYCNKGELESNRTPGNQRNITEQQLNDFMLKRGMLTANQSKTAFYVRSSSGDKQLIQNQIQELTQAYGQPDKIYKDNTSGLNENRKGFWQLIKDVEQGMYNQICLTYQDRLTRFGYTYIEHLIQQNGTKIQVLHEKKKYSLEEELMDDFMSLIASFSGRFYRIRGKKEQEKLLTEAKKLLNNEQKD